MLKHHSRFRTTSQIVAHPPQVGCFFGSHSPPSFARTTSVVIQPAVRHTFFPFLARSAGVKEELGSLPIGELGYVTWQLLQSERATQGT